jgi:hypothetical protein
MIREAEPLTTTGKSMVFDVQPHFSRFGRTGAGEGNVLGCIDAPRYIAAGSVRILVTPEADAFFHSLPTIVCRD